MDARREPHIAPDMTVVEVGVRQAWPFLVFAAEDGSEIRLYIDTNVQVTPLLTTWTSQDAPALWDALMHLNMLNVDEVTVVGAGDLQIEFDGGIGLTVSGEPNEATTGLPWRVFVTSGQP
jgi:hypothetical protein